MSEPGWLVVMALPLEAQDAFDKAGIPVLNTGIGRVNAAMTLTRALAHLAAAADRQANLHRAADRFVALYRGLAR